MTSRSPIASYLVALNRALKVSLARRRRILSETEQHLKQAAATAHVEGLDTGAAEATAVAAFGKPEVVAARFEPDLAGLLERRAGRALAWLELLTLRRPWTGAAVRTTLPAIPFVAVASWITVASGQPRMLSLLLLTATVWWVISGLRYRAVRDRPELGLRMRLSMWRQEHPLLDALARSSLVWAWIGHRVWVSGIVDALPLMVFIAVPLLDAFRVTTPRAGRTYSARRVTIARVAAWLPLSAMLVYAVVNLLTNRDTRTLRVTFVTVLAFGVAMLVVFVASRRRSQKAAWDRLVAWGEDHPWLAGLTLTWPLAALPLLAALTVAPSAHVPLFAALSIALAAVFSLVIGFGWRRWARARIDRDLEQQAAPAPD